MATQNQPSKPIAAFSCSAAELGELEAFDVLGDVAEGILRDAGGEVAKARAALIEAVRGGKHVELRMRATTFRQKDGHPNKNYLRFKSSKLGEIAASFKGKPFLLNHDKWDQAARMGTIEESEAVPLAGGWTGFRQVIRVVKPHAVISVLDGTLDQFSIGWDPRGTVVCTAHKVDVRSRKSCYWTEGCYPGKAVDIDGASQIAEYEWQSTEGVETSGVNTPAVAGTRIEEIKTALAAELGLAASHEPQQKDQPMKFPLLLAALTVANADAELTATDDARLAEAARELASGKLAAEQERDAAIKRAELAEGKRAELEAKLAELETAKVDAVLEAAYKAGKLIRGKDKDGKSTPSPREVRLRKIAKLDGLSALEAELAEMPVVAPVGRVELGDEDPNPRPSVGAAIPSNVLASTAKQLGIKPEELEAHHNILSGRDNSGGNN